MKRSPTTAPERNASGHPLLPLAAMLLLAITGAASARVFFGLAGTDMVHFTVLGEDWPGPVPLIGCVLLFELLLLKLRARTVLEVFAPFLLTLPFLPFALSINLPIAYAAAAGLTIYRAAMLGAFDGETAQKYPYSGLAATNYAELLYQAGDNAAVIKYIREQRALGKNDPDYYVYLARSYEALGKKSLSYAATGDMYALMNNPRAALYQFDLAQKANDADFYAMSEIDAKLRELRQQVLALDKKD